MPQPRRMTRRAREAAKTARGEAGDASSSQAGQEQRDDIAPDEQGPAGLEETLQC